MFSHQRWSAKFALEEEQLREGERFWASDKPGLQIFGARIRRGRLQAGLSQRSLAYKAGVSQSTISRLERGLAQGLTLVRLVAICSAFGADFPFGACPHPDHTCKWRGSTSIDAQRD